MKKAKCSRCKKLFRKDQLLDWLDGLDTLSPRFCPKCYSIILDTWEEGMDVESMPDD